MSGANKRKKTVRKAKRAAPRFGGPLTPAQQQIQADTKRENDEHRRWTCNVFHLWLVCGEKPCQRQRACSGDMHACFQRWWWLVPEQHKVFYRAWVKAGVDGLSKDDALRAARAEVVRRADHIAEVNAQTLARLDELEVAERAGEARGISSHATRAVNQSPTPTSTFRRPG